MIKKGSIIYLSYKLYFENKVVDESKDFLILEYGKTKINKELEKKLLNKNIGDIIEIKQKFNSNSPKIDLDLESLDEDTLENLKEDNIIEIKIKDKINLFVVKEIDENKGIVSLQYYNPYENKTLINKIKIEKIEKK